MGVSYGRDMNEGCEKVCHVVRARMKGVKRCAMWLGCE